MQYLRHFKVTQTDYKECFRFWVLKYLVSCATISLHKTKGSDTMNTPKIIAEKYLDVAQNKMKIPWYKTLMLAVMAGMFIAVGSVAATIASRSFEGATANIVKGAIFPVGLAMVIVAGSELFTGNCLLIMPLLQRCISLKGMAKNLAIVYVGNFIGSIIIALIATYSHAFQIADLAPKIVDIAEQKATLDFGQALLLGIMCNIFVSIAVWMSMSSNSASGKIVALYLPIMAFIICGFEHSVANMYYLTSGLLSSAVFNISAEGLTVTNCIFNNLIPVTLGNMIGGMVCVGLPYWFIYLHQEKSHCTAETQENEKK